MIFRFGEKVPFDTVVAIGMFDGVHTGHQKLLRFAIEKAKEMSLTPLVYTFHSHPIKETRRKYLTLFEERIALIKHFGIDNIYVAELNEAFMRIPAEQFFTDGLCAAVRAKAVVCGENFRFGYKRAGDINLMRELAERCGIKVYPLPLLKVDGTPVSSSEIHRLITSGKIEQANKMLGYNFFLGGEVVHGKGIGRKIGFPTANLCYKNGQKVLPANGVYVTYAELYGKFFKSVTNVGFNPTFENNKKVKVEIHFLGLNEENLYGKNVLLHFLKRIRPEKKFDSAAALSEQIKKDVAFSERYFSQHLIPDK